MVKKIEVGNTPNIRVSKYLCDNSVNLSTDINGKSGDLALIVQGDNEWGLYIYVNDEMGWILLKQQE